MNNIKDCEMIPITELLSEIIDNRGKTCPTEESGFPLIATNCIKHSSIYPTFENIRFVSDDTLKNWFRAELKPNDILFVNKGTPGRVCLVPNPVTFCAAQDMVGLRVNPEKIYYKYLFTVLRSDFIQEKIKNFHVGIAIPHFKKSDMHNLLIPVPKMDIQIKIGDTYCELSEKIENNNAMNNELESMAKTLYDYWFLQFEFPNEEGKPYKSSGGKMIWNEELKREIPEGWSCGKIGDLFESQAGYAFKSANWTENGHPVLTIKAIGEDGSIDMSAASYIKMYSSNLEKYSVNSGNMIFAMSGNTIGKLGIISSKLRNILINQRVLILKTQSDNIAYSYFTIRDNKIQNSILQLGANSAQPNISEETLKSIKICLPDKILLKKYNNYCKNYFEKIIENRIENQELASLRDFLLPLLMNGQVGFKEEE